MTIYSYTPLTHCSPLRNQPTPNPLNSQLHSLRPTPAHSLPHHNSPNNSSSYIPSHSPHSTPHSTPTHPLNQQRILKPTPSHLLSHHFPLSAHSLSLNQQRMLKPTPSHSLSLHSPLNAHSLPLTPLHSPLNAHSLLLNQLRILKPTPSYTLHPTPFPLNKSPHAFKYSNFTQSPPTPPHSTPTHQIHTLSSLIYFHSLHCPLHSHSPR